MKVVEVRNDFCDFLFFTTLTESECSGCNRLFLISDISGKIHYICSEIVEVLFSDYFIWNLLNEANFQRVNLKQFSIIVSQKTYPTNNKFNSKF